LQAYRRQGVSVKGTSIGLVFIVQYPIRNTQ